LNIIKSRLEIRRKDTELILHLFDLISCPSYVCADEKHKALGMFGVTDTALTSDSIAFKVDSQTSQQQFTKRFDFGKQLDAKRNQKVY